MTAEAPERVTVTPDALALLRRLKAQHGPLLLHLSGGCCEGTAPICLRTSDFRVGPDDMLLGSIENCPVYVGPHQAGYWADGAVTIGLTSGGADSFSLEAPDGVRFTATVRLLRPEDQVPRCTP